MSRSAVFVISITTEHHHQYFELDGPNDGGAERSTRELDIEIDILHLEIFCAYWVRGKNAEQAVVAIQQITKGTTRR